MTARRFAGHLGLRHPDVPLIGRERPCPTPDLRIAALAQAGFGGAFDNRLPARDDRWIDDLAKAATAHGLALTTFTHDPLRWNGPGWIDGTALDALPRSIDVAARTGVRCATCVTAPLPGLSHDEQLRRFAANLARAADRAGGQGLVLAVEATHPAFAPGLLVERLDDALTVVRLADHPLVRIMLDLGHVLLHGEDPVLAVERCAGLIGGVQFAEAPGRHEPGSGSTDWRPILAALARAGWASGLIDLECEPEAGEALLLRRIAALGATV